jgi:hypothetical protein
MTQAYDDLVGSPSTSVNRSELNLEERTQLRTISVRLGRNRSSTLGQFSTVYYLEGDEALAAERFVEEHEAQLEQIDFSGRNPIKSGVDRDIYDRILDELGERTLDRLESVVREDRPDGTTWFVDRNWYEEAPDRRYSITSRHSARLRDASPREIYDAFDRRITESDLEETTIEGRVALVLDYYRVSDTYPCLATTVDDELAVRKLPVGSGP